LELSQVALYYLNLRSLDDFERRLASERREARRALETGLAQATASAALAAEREAARRLEQWKLETERAVNEARIRERRDAEQRFNEDLRRHDEETSVFRNKLIEARRLVQDMANTTRAIKEQNAPEEKSSKLENIILAASEQIQALTSQLVSARAEAKRERERRLESEQKNHDYAREYEQQLEQFVAARIDEVLVNDQAHETNMKQDGKTDKIDAALSRLIKKFQVAQNEQQSAVITELLIHLRQREAECPRCDHWRRQAHEARQALEDAVDRFSEETQLKINNALLKRDEKHAAYIRDLRHRASLWISDIRSEWHRAARAALADQRRRLQHHRPIKRTSSSNRINTNGYSSKNFSKDSNNGASFEPPAFLPDHTQYLNDLFLSRSTKDDAD